MLGLTRRVKAVVEAAVARAGTPVPPPISHFPILAFSHFHILEDMLRASVLVAELCSAGRPRAAVPT